MIEPRPLSLAVRQFISENEHADIPSLLLKYKGIDGVPISAIADQIAGRRKARSKVPCYYAQQEVLYPPAVNLEQTSSEATARFKAKLLAAHLASADLPRHSLVDLTGGFGIDTYAFSTVFQTVTHVEPDDALQRLARYNHALLGSTNMAYENQTAEEYLKLMHSVSAVFIDPSRRNASRKVYGFHDCQPDIIDLQGDILRHTDVMLVKASPMHDIQLGLAELRHVKRVVVLAVGNEVRELLFLVVRGFSGAPVIDAVNLSTSDPVAFQFSFPEEQHAESTFADLKTFIYEPNAALLKAGAFKLVSGRYKVHKLHVNTHLYTSDKLVSGFPGRIFRVVSPLKADHAAISNLFPEGKANVITRNYPSTPEALKKKLKLGDGGDRYLLAFTASTGPTLVAAERLA